MIDALKDAGFDRKNKDHIFVRCGDLLDRGQEAAECLKYVNSLDRKILIRGNHEDLMHDMLERGFPQEHDFGNGTYNTLLQLAAMVGDKKSETFFEKMFDFVKTNSEYKEYDSSTINYYETSKYIFVHGWIPCVHSDKNIYHTRNVKYSYNPAWRDASETDWAAARWPNGMECWNQGVSEPNKTIVCGHWHSSWGTANYTVAELSSPITGLRTQDTGSLTLIRS